MLDANQSKLNDLEADLKVNYQHLDEGLVTKASKALQIGQSKKLQNSLNEQDTQIKRLDLADKVFINCEINGGLQIADFTS